MAAKAYCVPGMVVSVESYIGEKGGREGVKLEDEVLVTETGTELHLALSLSRTSCWRTRSECSSADSRSTERSRRCCFSICRRSSGRTRATWSRAIDDSPRQCARAAGSRARQRRCAVFHCGLHRRSRTRAAAAVRAASPPTAAPAFSDKDDPADRDLRARSRPRGGEPVIYQERRQRLLRGRPAAARCAGARRRMAGRRRRVDRGLRRRDGARRDRAAAFACCWSRMPAAAARAAMHQTAILNLANRLYGGAVDEHGDGLPADGRRERRRSGWSNGRCRCASPTTNAASLYERALTAVRGEAACAGRRR